MPALHRRAVLEGVPKVAFAPIHDGRYELTPFPSCLKAVSAYLGRKTDYHTLLGASGAAFRMVWHKQRWEGGNVDIMRMAPDPLEPACRALDAAGMAGEFLMRRTATHGLLPEAARRAFLAPYETDDDAEIKARIVRSVDAGIPVIAFGVVGPPEACIVSGYDDGGDTLIGWSMFQEHLDPAHDLTGTTADELNPPSGMEPDGTFRRDDWARRTLGIVALEQRPPADLDAVYRRALAWIPTILKGAQVYDSHTGRAAYDAYLAHLGDEAEFAADDLPTLAIRKMVHYDAMTMIAERSSGAQFVRDIAARDAFTAGRAALEAAADAFASAAEQMAGWWQVVGPIWADEEAQVRATADPGVRRAFLPFIERARDADAAASEHVERALVALRAVGV